jgi:5-methylcytosine-specific restriction endonuclease McrA
MFKHIGLFCSCEGRYCGSCDQMKCQRAFSKDRKGAFGLSCRCKDCTRDYQKSRIDQINARRRENRREKAEHYKAYEREFHCKNPEPKKDRDRKYRKEHAEKIKAYTRDYKRTNEQYRVHKLEYNREYFRNHPEKNAQYLNNRRSRKQQTGGSFTANEWLELCIRYHWTCLCCKRCEPEITLTVDHIIPLSKGGSNAIANIQPLCLNCNLRKGTKTKDYRPWFNRPGEST